MTREWAGRRINGERFGANLAEECVWWLEARGKAVRGTDRRWRMK